MVLLCSPVRRGNQEKCKKWWCGDTVVKKIVGATRRVSVSFVLSWRGKRIEHLVRETLHHNSSSFPVPQTTPPAAKARAIDIGRSGVQFMDSPSAPSFTSDTKVVGSGIPQSPVTILTFVGLVRVPARP